MPPIFLRVGNCAGPAFLGRASAETGGRLERIETNSWSELGQRLKHLRTACEQMRYSLDRSETKLAEGSLKIMTKVIWERSDERGGCRNAHPDVAENLAEKMIHRRHERD